MDDGPVLFFDGECGLCAKAVRWCLRHDRGRVLRFAPLQGETYRALTTPGKPTDMQTMVLHDSGGLHVRSDAVLRMMRHVGGVWAAVGACGRIVPRSLRDALYRQVAKRRMLWFGAAGQCDLPREGDRERFLP